jgi:hypothetical protein
MDLWMVYEAWLFNDRLPQEWFDHPGYLTILLFGGWFRALHAVGLLDVSALSALPAPPDAGPAWTAATKAARVASLLTAGVFVAGFGWLLRRLIGDWRVAVLATFLLTFSGGLAMSARMLRTELISGGALTIALLLLLIAARSPAARYRPLWVGVAAFLVMLGHINKVQLIFLACALPLVVLPFGVTGAEPRRGLRALDVAAALIAVALAVPAISLVKSGLAQASLAPWLIAGVNMSGLYQAGIALWVVACIAAFAILWRVSAAETFATAMCVLAGCSLALLSLYLRYSPQNVIIAINPLEQLLYWARASGTEGSGLLAGLWHGFLNVVTTRTFVLDSSARPTIFLEWLTIAGTIWAWRSGRRILAFQVATLIATGWAMDTLYAIRGLKLQYFILTDPLIVIAAAYLVANFEPLRTHRRAFQVGIVLLAVHVAVSQAEPVKQTFSRSKPLAFCVGHFGYTKRIETFPFCLPAATEPPAK